MKIEHLAAFKRRHGFTRRDRLVAHLPRRAATLARWQPLVSALMKLPGAAAAAEALTGFDRRRPLPAFHRAWTLGTAPQRGQGAPVVLFADTFNNWLEPANLEAAAKVLEACGHRVLVAHAPDERPLCCGRTYLAAGMVDEARAEARRTLEALRPHLEAGTPVVGLEPSCVFTFRDEIPALLPGDPVANAAARIEMADAYLAQGLREGRLRAPWRGFSQPIRVHGHCHQKAFGAFEATLELLRQVPGADVQAIESSCCGMAGAFGHEREHYDVSMRMGELALFPAVRANAGATIAAAGTSCRQQVADGTGREALHPMRLLAEAL
jgi:Fe-S oxidoreductase